MKKLIIFLIFLLTIVLSSCNNSSSNTHNKTSSSPNPSNSVATSPSTAITQNPEISDNPSIGITVVPTTTPTTSNSIGTTPPIESMPEYQYTFSETLLGRVTYVDASLIDDEFNLEVKRFKHVYTFLDRNDVDEYIFEYYNVKNDNGNFIIGKNGYIKVNNAPGSDVKFKMFEDLIVCDSNTEELNMNYKIDGEYIEYLTIMMPNIKIINNSNSECNIGILEFGC